jgi:hypothetical protein
MIRSKRKPAYLYSKFYNFCTRCLDIKRLTLRMKRRKLMFHIRNKRSVFDFGSEILRWISKYKFYVYNGMSYMSLELDKYVLNSVIGEFIFTKIRSNVIHSSEKRRKGSKKGKQRVNRKSKKRRYFLGFNSKRARSKERSKARSGV